MTKVPNYYVVGPNTHNGYNSQGDTHELAVPDYMHPDLQPTKCDAPARVALWFRTWDEATQFLAALEQLRTKPQPDPNTGGTGCTQQTIPVKPVLHDGCPYRNTNEYCPICYNGVCLR